MRKELTSVPGRRSVLTQQRIVGELTAEKEEFKSTTPSKRLRIIDGACSSKFRIHAWKRLPGTDCFGPADIGWRILRSLDHGPAGLGVETGRFQLVYLPHADHSLQGLTTLMPNPLVVRHTVHLP